MAVRRFAVLVCLVLAVMGMLTQAGAFDIGIKCQSDTYGHLFVSMPDCNPWCGHEVMVTIYAESPDGSIRAYYDPFDANAHWKLDETSFVFGATVVPDVDIAGYLMIPAHVLSQWRAGLVVEVNGERHERTCTFCGAEPVYCALLNNLVGNIMSPEEMGRTCIERGCGFIDGRCTTCSTVADATSCNMAPGCTWNGTACVPTCSF